MRKEKKNKKNIIIAIVFSVILIFSIFVGIVPIFYNPSLSPRMVEYYSNNQNYVELEGEIVEICPIDTIYLFVSVEYGFEQAFIDGSYNKCPFQLFSPKNIIDFLAVGDVIKIISATRCFYDGHVSSIVSLELNGEVLLTFEEGKAGLLEWASKVK